MHPYGRSEMSRRQFLHQSAAGIGGALITANLISTGVAATKKIPIGLQLYSLREQCKTDLPGMLNTVAKVGYHGVEFAGYHGRTAKELRQMLDENQLVACGTHTAYESVLADKLQETIDFNRVIGNNFLIVPWMTAKSKQEWEDKAKLFNEISAKLKPEGMWIGYHAHAHDFEKFDGQSAWDIFFGQTNSEVIMQLDTSNCCEGGADPVAVLKKYPGRVRSIHIKAHGNGADAVVGEDTIHWPEVFSFCESQGGTQWYVLEHESAADPVKAVTRSFEALKKMGKA
jgi:sugar phosphate isomerase/epimerase